jgi:hypothetical protein
VYVDIFYVRNTAGCSGIATPTYACVQFVTAFVFGRWAGDYWFDFGNGYTMVLPKLEIDVTYRFEIHETNSVGFENPLCLSSSYTSCIPILADLTTNNPVVVAVNHVLTFTPRFDLLHYGTIDYRPIYYGTTSNTSSLSDWHNSWGTGIDLASSYMYDLSITRSTQTFPTALAPEFSPNIYSYTVRIPRYHDNTFENATISFSIPIDATNIVTRKQVLVEVTRDVYSTYKYTYTPTALRANAYTYVMNISAIQTFHVYTLTVIQEALGVLSSLSVSDSVLTPIFTPYGTAQYTASVANYINFTTVSLSAEAGVIVQIIRSSDGTIVSTDDAKDQRNVILPLLVGVNTFTITLSGQLVPSNHIDYTIRITRNEYSIDLDETSPAIVTLALTTEFSTINRAIFDVRYMHIFIVASM